MKGHPEYIVRTQKGYSPLDLLKDKQEEAKTPRQKLFQAIAAPLPVTNIGVAATADFLGKAANPEQVIFQVYIEGKNIDYKEENNRHHFALEMVTVVYDSHGKPVTTYDDKAEGNILPEHFEEARTSGFKYNKALNLKPGLYQIRIGVREPSTERMGTAMAWITVPNILKNKFAMSGLLIGDKSGNSHTNVSQGKTENKPSEIKEGIRFYKVGSSMVYNVRLYNIASRVNQGADLQAQALIEDSGKLIASVPWQPVNSITIGKDTSSIDIGGQLTLDIEPGIYELHLQIKDQKMKHPLEQVVVFAVER